MKSPIIGIIAVVIVLLAGARLFWFYGSQPEPGEPVPHLMPLACADCGKSYVANAGNLPTKCAFCKKQTAWRAQKCAKCKTIFPLIEPQTDSDAPPQYKCTKCGSTKFGEVPPDEVKAP